MVTCRDLHTGFIGNEGNNQICNDFDVLELAAIPMIMYFLS